MGRVEAKFFMAFAITGLALVIWTIFLMLSSG